MKRLDNARLVAEILFQMCRPIIKNTVLFRSFGGQYNDNPRYISQELHRRSQNVNIVWAVGDGEQSDFPEYVKTVALDSKEYIKYVSRAEVVVDNYLGCRTNYLKRNDPIKRLVFWIISRHRRGQLCISTWHGTPLKCIALDEPQYKNSEFAKCYSNADVLIAGCRLTKEAFKTAFAWERDVLMCGTPRNDILINGTSEDIRHKLGLPKDKKILLFAPTFRNDPSMSGIGQIESMDIEKLMQVLSDRFGGEWCFVFRSHDLVMAEMEKGSFSSNKDIINGNAHSDMAEYLFVADALLTDYSSSMFDYMLTKRPTFLYAPDLYEYKNSERGFYFDIESTPFSISKSFEELINNIKEFNQSDYEERVDRFLSKIGNAEDGSASASVVDMIERHLEVQYEKN